MKLSNDAQSLFAAARGDGPSRKTTDAMWNEVELGLALVPAAAPSGVRATTPSSAPATPPPVPLTTPPVPFTPPPPPVVATSSIALKAGLIGGGVGSGATVIAVILAMNTGIVRPPSVDANSSAVDHAREAASSERAPSILVPFVGPAAQGNAMTHDDPLATSPSTPLDSDLLGREVSLVIGAREALLGGDAARALDLARRARALRGQLAKEALTLEVRALRALAREAEADRAEMELRVLHPSR